MTEIYDQFPKPPKLGEDVHLTNCLEDHEVPSVSIAKEVTVEWNNRPDPCGLHQSWRFHTIDYIVTWFEHAPRFTFKNNTS